MIFRCRRASADAVFLLLRYADTLFYATIYAAAAIIISMLISILRAILPCRQRLERRQSATLCRICFYAATDAAGGAYARCRYYSGVTPLMLLLCHTLILLIALSPLRYADYFRQMLMIFYAAAQRAAAALCRCRRHAIVAFSPGHV